MKRTSRALVAGYIIVLPCVVLSSNLSETASAIEPGESIRMTTPVSGSVLSPPEDGSNFLQWGSSGVWDSIRKEVRFVGKRDGSNAPYRFLTYHADTDIWGIDRSSPASTGSYGHGYDHNTVGPATGEHYFRLYNSRTIKRWNGEWSSLPAMPESNSVAATVSWVTGIGLVYSDEGVIQYFDGNSWEIIESSPPNFGYHVASEYNEFAGILVIGGGNSMPRGISRMGSDKALRRGADAPFDIGSSKRGSVLVSDPTSQSLIAWSKEENSWAEYDIAGDRWNVLERSSGDGSAPQIGLPNLSGSEYGRSTIGVSIDSLGVVMFIQYLGSGTTPAGVWLYRHSSDNRMPKPKPPKLD